MKKIRRSAETTAKLIAINGALYGEERQRQVTRYRFSFATLRALSGRTALRESFLSELEYELMELNWLFVRLGAEYGVISLEKADTWVKLSSKRLKDSEQNFLTASEDAIEKRYEAHYAPPEDEDNLDD